MPLIHLITYIDAPLQRIFNLSRSIDLHTKSMSHTGERAIAGKTKGLIEQGETVTWEAKHLFKKRYLKMAITHMQPYSFFQDEMIEGDFKKITHEHHFKQAGSKIKMTDIFVFETPFNIIGRLVNVIFLLLVLVVLPIRGKILIGGSCF